MKNLRRYIPKKRIVKQIGTFNLLFVLTITLVFGNFPLMPFVPPIPIAFAAITSAGTLGAVADKTANQDFVTLTTTATAEVGNVIIVSIAKDNIQTTPTFNDEVFSVTDSAGNTYSEINYGTYSPGAAQTGASAAVWMANVTNQLNSGGTITATFATSASNDAAAMSAWEYTVGAGSYMALQKAGGSQTSPTGPAAFGIINVSPVSDYLFLRMTAAETDNSTLTATTTGWTRISGANTTGSAEASNISVTGEFKFITSTTSATSTPTLGDITNDSVSLIQAFKEVSITAPTLTTNAATAVAASSATLNANITDTGGANATSRGFASSTDAAMVTGVSTTTVSGSFGTGTFTGLMGGLSANTTYYFRAFATNSAGTGYGSIQSYTTVPNAPGAPSSANTLATTTALTWTTPSGGASSYKLEQCVNGSNTCSLFTGISSNSTTTYSLTPGTSYDYAVKATNATGDSSWSSTTTIQTLYATTTLADATDPSSVSIAPGDNPTLAGSFTLQSLATTPITALVVNLGSSASAGVGRVDIVDSAASTTYGSITNPSSDTPTVTLNAATLNATTSATIYKIRITPKSHSDMPPPSVGVNYSVQAKINSVTLGGPGVTQGSDTAGTTIIIDNASPANVTSGTASAGNNQVSLSWTNPADGDYAETVVLRATSTVPIATSTFEGTLYAASGSFSNTSITGVGLPYVARLSSTTIAFVDWGNNSLRTYSFDGTSWSQVGSGKSLNGFQNFYGLTALNSTDVALADVEPSNGKLAVYRFDGSTWSLLGSSTTVPMSTPTVTALNTTDIAYYDVAASGKLALYRNNGSTWSEVGASTTISSAGQGSITALSSSTVAFIDGTNQSLRAYTFNGSGWTLVGSGLSISVSGPPVISALSSTTISYFDYNGIRTYTFDGSNWRQVGNLFVTGSADYGSIAALNATDVAYIDRTDSRLRVARWDGSNWTQNKFVVASSSVVCVTTGTSCTDTGAQNGNSYNYKIYSRDLYGNYSTGVIPTGSPATPAAVPPTLTTDSASTVTDTSATLNATTNSTGGSTITARGFATSTVSNLTSDVSTSTTSGSFGATPFSLSAQPLSSNTTYYFRAFATNSSGTGYGGIQSLLTLPGAPDVPTYTFTTATTTNVTWSAAAGGASTYKLEQCVNGTSTCSLFTGIGGNSTTTYSLTGNTSYDYAVRGTNATGDGTFSGTTTRLTLPDIPGTPTFATIANNTLTVNWVGSVGSSSSYKIERCTGAACSNFVQIASGVGTTTYPDSGLSSGTTYRYRVRGTNATGDGGYSVNASVTTTGGAGGAIVTGGGYGGGSDIGGPAPAGQGTVSGGSQGNDGIGQEIGGEPGFVSPTANALAWGSAWTNPTFIYVQNGLSGSSPLSVSASDFYNYSFAIPSGDTITGITVKVLARVSIISGGTFDTELSWNGGSATTTSGFNSGTLTTTNTVYTFGSNSSLWGRSWTPSEFADANFRVRLISHPATKAINFDAIQVNVYHQATGGGGGGGSDI